MAEKHMFVLRFCLKSVEPTALEKHHATTVVSPARLNMGK